MKSLRDFPSTRFEVTGSQALQMLTFVSMDALPNSHLSGLSRAKRSKIAIIHALIPARQHDIGIKAQGIGRGVRTAATRALLNLLGKPSLRGRQFTNLQIELSVFNLSEVQNNKPDSLPD